MKQLGLACHNYNDTFGSLPPAVLVGNGIGWNDAYNVGPNWLVLILPYMEQGNLYQQYANSIQNYQNFSPPNPAGLGVNDQGWRGMRNIVIRNYQCPSEGFKQTQAAQFGGAWARGNYAANAGPGDPGTLASVDRSPWAATTA